MCVAPFVAWRPRSEPQRAHHDDCGAASPGGIEILGTLVRHCIVTNWDDMGENSFHKELGVTLEGHPVLPTEAVLNPEADRERTWRPRLPFFTPSLPPQRGRVFGMSKRNFSTLF